MKVDVAMGQPPVDVDGVRRLLEQILASFK
jgi:hypothetical protein